MTIYELKPAFQNLLRPLCTFMAKKGVRPNHVTLLALIMSFLAGMLIWLSHGAAWSLVLIPIILFVRMALNAIDGMLAREHNMKTPLGAILNELGDVMSDTVLYLPFAVIPGVSAYLTVFVVILSVISEMTGVIAVQIGASRRYDGPMGKSDRAFAFGVLSLLLFFGIQPGVWLDIMLFMILILLILTIVNRARHALTEVKL